MSGVHIIAYRTALQKHTHTHMHRQSISFSDNKESHRKVWTFKVSVYLECDKIATFYGEFTQIDAFAVILQLLYTFKNIARHKGLSKT